MKLDLVMWTLNSERTLAKCLESIKRAIPSTMVAKRIVVDGHSEDDTKSIAQSFGWNVYEANKIGIPFQANQALSLVTQNVFASFEHDIILNPNWYRFLFPYILQNDVAVVQGVRVSTVPISREIDMYGVLRSRKDNMHLRSHISIDNNLYKTSVIRKIGGFPTDCLVSTDQFLREKLENEGFKWVIEPRMVSNHLRDSIKNDITHLYELARRSKKASISRNTLLALYSPVSSLKIALKMGDPRVFLVYPQMRLAKLRGVLHRK